MHASGCLTDAGRALADAVSAGRMRRGCLRDLDEAIHDLREAVDGVDLFDEGLDDDATSVAALVDSTYRVLRLLEELR